MCDDRQADRQTDGQTLMDERRLHLLKKGIKILQLIVIKSTPWLQISNKPTGKQCCFSLLNVRKILLLLSKLISSTEMLSHDKFFFQIWSP